jgi:hypothetical protein
MRLSASELVLNSMIWERPADRFSKIMLSMHTYFDPGRGKASNHQEEILEKIANVQMFIGIVGEPELTDECCERIFAVAEKLRAMVFTGNALLHWDGSALIEPKQ